MNKPTIINLVRELKVEYEINIDDIMAFYSYNFQRAPASRVRSFLRFGFLAGSILLACAAAVLWIFIEKQLLWVLFLAIVAVMMLFQFFFYPFWTRKSLKYTVLKIYGKDKNILIGKHRLSITPTAVMDITDVGETTTSWDTIEYVEAYDQYLFMLVRGSGPYIVPKKAFADDKAFKQFTETASAYHQASVATKVRPNLDLQQS